MRVKESSAPRRLRALGAGLGERGLLLESLDAGARGFVLKESSLAALARAIRSVAGGGTYIDPVLAGVVAGPRTETLPTLTKRESARALRESLIT